MHDKVIQAGHISIQQNVADISVVPRQELVCRIGQEIERRFVRAGSIINPAARRDTGKRAIGDEPRHISAGSAATTGIRRTRDIHPFARILRLVEVV